jgi:hypothetical protein
VVVVHVNANPDVGRETTRAVFLAYCTLSIMGAAQSMYCLNQSD